MRHLIKKLLSPRVREGFEANEEFLSLVSQGFAKGYAKACQSRLNKKA
ncbi:MAG: hypothetical protein QW067_12450 [Thermofilaceae archaeon]